MACNNCGDGGGESPLQTLSKNQPNENNVYLKCANNHKLLKVNVNKGVVCGKTWCNKKERSFKGYCSSDCPDWSDEIVVRVTCPECKTVRAYYYSNCSVQLSAVNNDGNVLAANTEISGNCISITPVVIEVDSG